MHNFNVNTAAGCAPRTTGLEQKPARKRTLRAMGDQAESGVALESRKGVRITIGKASGAAPLGGADRNPPLRSLQLLFSSGGLKK